MKTMLALLTSALLLCACALAQAPAPEMEADAMLFQQQLPPLPPPEAGATMAAPNVIFRTQALGDGKMSTGFFAVAEGGKPIIGMPYSATATTESTQVLGDGNRIVNKSSAQMARDGQGRTRREESMQNLGPVTMNGPRMAFIQDPVAKVSYVLDLTGQTADVIKISDMATVTAMRTTKPMTGNITSIDVQKRVIVAGPAQGAEQRIWVDTANDAAQAKTESLGTQVIEGVSAEGTRVTRTIPAGQIGNERPIEITSEVWTSPELQMVILSKRSDPRVGETVYRVSDIRRAEPDPSLFQVPSGFTVKNHGN